METGCGDNENVIILDTGIVLDREQLREVTLDDEDLMRELVDALIKDTEKQLPLLREAVAAMDGAQCARLAHYCKGACSNVGALAAAETLKKLERHATAGDISECGLQVRALGMELDRLRAETI